MEALKRLSLAVAMLALAGVGCGDDDDDGVVDSGIDAGPGDSGMDANVPDSAKPDSSAPDSSTPSFACKATTAPTSTMCGGLHCEQTPAQLKASRLANSVCGTDMEINGLCQVTAIGVVQQCTLTAFTSGAPDLGAATKTCAMGKQPTMAYSSQCLDCFVGAGTCAAAKCAAKCLDAASPACAECQITNGCISSFYTCIGVDNPIPGM